MINRVDQNLLNCGVGVIKEAICFRSVRIFLDRLFDNGIADEKQSIPQHLAERPFKRPLDNPAAGKSAGKLNDVNLRHGKKPGRVFIRYSA